MNSKLIAAAVVALSSLGATAAFAETYGVVQPTSVSNTTRAEVLAEVAKARADGTLQFSNEMSPVVMAAKPVPSQLTRSEVRKEGTMAMTAQRSDFGGNFNANF